MEQQSASIKSKKAPMSMGLFVSMDDTQTFRKQTCFIVLGQKIYLKLLDLAGAEMKKIIKQSTFIVVEEIIYIPPPTSWGSGLAKIKWFKKITGKTPRIVSSEKWQNLKSEKRTLVLVEYNDHTWESFNE